MVENAFDMLKKCRIAYKNECISGLQIIETLTDYVYSLANCDEKRNGVIYHTGSIIYDVTLICCCAIACILNDEATPESVVQGLNIEDKVVFEKRRYIIKSKAPDLVELYSDASKMKITLRKNCFYKIKPYYGSAKSLTGKGLRKVFSPKYDFFEKVFNTKSEDIPTMNSKSILIVCSKAQADMFIDEIKIYYGDRAFVKLNDLMTVSYFPDSFDGEENERRYSGNPNRIPSVVKFTNKVSKAREMVLDNANINALIILGKNYIENDYGEIESLFNRKRLKHCIISIPIGSDDTLVNNAEVLEKTDVFACTKDMLLTYANPQEKIFGFKTKNLNQEIDTILNRVIEKCIIDDSNSIITNSDFKKIISGLNCLREYSDNETIQDFIIKSYMVFNFITVFPLPVKIFNNKEDLFGENTFDILSVLEKLKSISLNDVFNLSMKGLLRGIYDVLADAYSKMYDYNPKEILLMKHLAVEKPGSSVLILVAKASQCSILKNFLNSKINHSYSLYVNTYNNYDHSIWYDEILVLGCIGYKNSTIFTVYSSTNIHCFLYAYEVRRFNYLQSKFELYEQHLNEISCLPYELDDQENKQETNSDLTCRNRNDEIDIIDYFVNDILSESFVRGITNISRNCSATIEVKRVAKTSDGDAIFFSKRYQAYKLDPKNRTFILCTSEEIQNGDTLLFTKNNNQAKDIVDEIIEYLASSNDKIRDVYEKSKYWKNALLQFKKNSGYSNLELAKMLEQKGMKRGQATLGMWMDSDSHIIGPREEKAFSIIADIIQDEYMLNNPQSYFFACNNIRKKRTTILHYIGRLVIKRYQMGVLGQAGMMVTLADTVNQKFGELSQIVTIEEIHDISPMYVSTTYANRPCQL